jgi:hypothetical protein
MTEFERRRGDLAEHRRQVEQKRQEALLSREAVKRAERALARQARREDPRREGDRTRLEEALERARARARRAERDLAETRASEGSLWERFEQFTDPRDRIGEWPDRYPILLFPLRLETRFKTGEAGGQQLWVRVYPDTCLVDTFEESLTEQEVANGGAFWAAVWRAGGDEALERAAWRELVAAHGAGRAGWIVRRHAPLNPNEKPVKDSESDVLLITMAPEPLPAAATDFWAAAWKANGNQASEQAAYATLEGAVGPERAREIADRYRPFNFSDTPAAPRTREEVRVKVAVLQLPPLEEMDTRRTSWSSAPRIDLLPERFVFVGYGRNGASVVEIGRPIRTPLIAGPDPNAPPDQQMKPTDDALQIPDELAWMFDFERAVDVGMAVRVDLSVEQARDGFERVIVLGVRLANSPRGGQDALERLLEHHLYSRAGLQLIPQGTPTNNTEKGGSGYSSREDPEATFDVFFRQTPQYAVEGEALLRPDGQWLAELLGVRHELVQRVPGAGGSDGSEARAMQIALWPGTLGYMMKTLLAPVFTDQDVAATRAFFTRYVSGRGPLPALRIGTQPYGILPTAAFDRIDWFRQDEGEGYLGRLYDVIKRIQGDWERLVDRVSYVGKGDGDPHQILLDVLGLHPGSVEYFPLQAESVQQKFYELAFLDHSMSLDLLGRFPPASPLDVLRRLGYMGEDVPDLLNHVYRARQTPLTGPSIDDRPLSETEPIRSYAGDRNYIEWLVDAAESGIERIQQEQGFDGDRKPAALLYLLLRHALQLAFQATGVRLQAEAGLVEDTGLALREPAFVHVREARGESESRYDVLFRPEEVITGRSDLILGDYIAGNARVLDSELREQIEALERLSRVPTARLERIFAEHIDCCTYRLDSWKTGLLAWELENMRERSEGLDAEEKGSGLFLGAFGWLEPVRPEGKVLAPAELPDDVAKEVNRRDRSPLLRDDTNEGLIHAPSLNHATTAAVLRNGYVANEGRLAVNLSSRRVRLALGILEGMRTGQSVGALLGYQFERHVHDQGPLQVRELIYPLRRAFPLAANQIQKTATDEGEAQESIAAMNVIDGRKLVEHVQRTRTFTYPFGVDTLPRRAADQEAALTDALEHVLDINDAVADLALAEGVHQAVQGNYDRSAGTLDAFAKGSSPPEPEVIRTPRSGIGLTLRAAIHLPPAPPANPLPAIPLTPLVEAEPAVNAWLGGRLPAPADVGCEVSFTDRATDAVRTVFISQEQLELHPIDLVYRSEIGAEQTLKDLDDRILTHLQANHAVRHDREIRIHYTQRVAGRITWFELQALLRSLRAMVIAARPLQPADLVLPNEATRNDQGAVMLPKGRIQDARDDLLNNVIPALDTLTAALGNAAITIDDALRQYAATVARLAAYRLPQTGTGFVFEWRAGVYTALTERVSGRLKVWNDRLAQFDTLLDDYDTHVTPTTPEEDRIARLQAAEALIRAELSTPVPTASAYRLALDGERAAFVTKRDALQALVNDARPTLAELLADAKAELPLSTFDLEPFDFSEEDAEIARFRAELTQSTARLRDDVGKRLDRVDALLAEHDAAGGAQRVTLLQEAGSVLFGDDFRMVPLVTLPAGTADELANAWEHSASGELTQHLTDPLRVGHDFPVDDWLHGAARVRDQMHHWENIVLLGDAFDVGPSAELTPLQLPHGADEPWLALEIPEGYAIDGDRLLYTAHFAEPFDRTEPVCGLLLDEWTEVIPGAEETTGIAFHFDRPNAEPPQSWLLALPSVGDGSWSWDELVAAVNDALDSAKHRAIEPVHVAATGYSWFLPATVSAYTFPEVSISNNFLRNLELYTKLMED